MSRDEINKKQRERYAEDAAYRERLCARRRARYAQDPEFRKRARAISRACRLKREEKVRSDPELREKERTRQRTKTWRNKSKIVGMTWEQYGRMHARQRSKCKICRIEDPHKTLCV